MDDKVFIFIFLIPGLILFINYLLLRKMTKGLLVFRVQAALIIGYIIVFKLIIYFSPGTFHGIGAALSILVYWYVLMLGCLIFSMVFAFVSERRRKKH